MLDKACDPQMTQMAADEGVKGKHDSSFKKKKT
jgi:hypothetical protein